MGNSGIEGIVSNRVDTESQASYSIMYIIAHYTMCFLISIAIYKMMCALRWLIWGRTVFIGGLCYDTRPEELRDFINSKMTNYVLTTTLKVLKDHKGGELPDRFYHFIADVSDVRMPLYDRKGKKENRGYAFVDARCRDDAMALRDTLHGSVLDNCELRVVMARTRRH
jgi:hypothetical protein